MREIPCETCGELVVAPEGPVLVRHVEGVGHDCVRIERRADPVAVAVEGEGMGTADGGLSESRLSKALPSFQEALAAVSLLRANVVARLDQLEVQMSGVIVRDLAALVLRVSELEQARGSVEGASPAELDNRLRNVEQVLKLRSEVGD